MVLKMAFPIELKEGIASNKYEVDAFNKFPTVFPRSYVYDRSSDGPEWLVIEKVHVVESGPEYAEVIDNTFPSLGKAASLLAGEGYRNVDPSWIFERILDIYDEDENGDYDLWMDLIFHHRRGKTVDEETRKRVADATWFIATNDEKLMRFITICKNLNVHFDEIREGNVGTNEEKNKLVLIDISKFEFLNKEPDRGVYEEYPVNNDHYDHSTKNIETDSDYEKVRTGQWRRINESLRDDHKEKLIKLLLSNIEGAEQAFDLMRGLELSEQEISALVFPQLPSMLLKNIEYAEFAIKTMDDLGFDDDTIIDIINDAIESDPVMSKTPIGWGNPLQQRLKREINVRLMRGLEAFDLGDFNEW